MAERDNKTDLLQNYFVTRGHSPGKPYDAVTRLPFDEALRICEATYPWRGTGEAKTDGHRDQADYLRLRIAADDWLREQATAAGVRIDDKCPVAFTFVREPEKLPKAKLEPVGDRETTKLAVKDLDLSNWSFTFDDSITNYTLVHEGRTAFEEAAHPVHGKVMNAQQLAAAIEKYGDTNPDGTPRVIEAQMWAREPTLVHVRQLTPQDWQAYRDYYKGLKQPHQFASLLAGHDLDARETYTNLFDKTIGTGSLVMFGLWQGEKMIGQSSINFIEEDGKKIALLAGSEIADDYRGRRLVDRFYQARMQYLRDIKFEGEIMTTIRPENENSIKAAQRNGFVNTATLDRHGYLIFVPGENMVFQQEQQQARHRGAEATLPTDPTPTRTADLRTGRTDGPQPC